MSAKYTCDGNWHSNMQISHLDYSDDDMPSSPPKLERQNAINPFNKPKKETK